MNKPGEIIAGVSRPPRRSDYEPIVKGMRVSTLPLTERQEQLWRFIRSCDRSPSYSEMALAIYGHLNAKGRINNMVCALKERGFVDYIPNRPRSIIALDPRENLSGASTAALLAELENRGVVIGARP